MQTFVVRLVMSLKYKDGHKTHYASDKKAFVIRRERQTMQFVLDA